MATDATSTPTSLGIPKYNTAVDAPSGKGFNAAIDVIDGLIAARIAATLIDAKGDLLAGTGSDAIARLAVGADGKFLKANSAQSTGLEWVTLPSSGITEVAYNEFTSAVTISATTEATATTIVTATSFTADGTSAYLIEFFAPRVDGQNQQDPSVRLVLYQDGSSIGFLGDTSPNVSSGAEGASVRVSAFVVRRLVPASGSRTYSIRAFHSGTNNPTVQAGAGGSGVFVPGFIRITKVT